MKKLGSLNKAAAWLIAAAMVLIAVFGIGGLKLSSKYNAAEKNFNKSFSAASDAGSFDSLYASMISYAEQIYAVAANELGSENSSVGLLSKAIQDAKACSGDHAKAYVETDKLEAAVNSAYNAIENKSAALKRLINEFDEKPYMISNTYTAAYIEYLAALNDLKGGFPTSAIKALWGLD